MFDRIANRLLGWPARRRRPERVIDREYARWVARAPSAPAALPEGPLISVLMPVHETPPDFFQAALRSVQAQGFSAWELCIADDASASPALRACLEIASRDDRVRIVTLGRRAGIAGATNAALGLARGAFVALMDHDDLLSPEALGCMAAAIAAWPEADVFFSDEDKLVRGKRVSPYFKPGWNPDLMLAQNLVSHLGVYRRSLVNRLGGLREGFDGSQDFDLALRASRVAREIRHVPRVLYHWRQGTGSFSAIHAEVCAEAARRALRDHLGAAARVVPDPALPQWTRIVYPVPAPAPLVSLIVAGVGAAPRDAFYPNVEVLRAGPGGAGGEVLVFIAAGLEPAGPGWLRELVSHALRPEIGCAGARLDGPDGAILHAGFSIGPDRVARSPRPRSDADDPGYRGHFRLVRSVAAVSEDCLAIRREVFEGAIRTGVEQDQALASGRDGVGLCLRLAGLGLRTVWSPHARLAYQHPPRDAAPVVVDGNDPYANPNIEIRAGNYILAAGGSAHGFVQA